MKGIVIPIGGNEDKGANEYFGIDAIEDAILFQILDKAQGPNSKVVVIPTASSIPEEVGELYVKGFNKLGCSDVTVLNIQSKKEANNPINTNIIKNSNCLMFSGGDQSRIKNIIGGSKIHELILNKLNNEEFVLAGTSAGAMAMTNEMIAGGSATESLLKGAVKLYKGLGVLPEFIIDTHFVKRGRFGRLAEAVAAFPHLIGIGLSEDTGLIIINNEFEVIGSGMVIVFDPSNLTHNKHAQLKQGTPISMSNLTTHIFARGDKFSIEDRKIEISKELDGNSCYL
jgi:cyanophycinase